MAPEIGAPFQIGVKRLLLQRDHRLGTRIALIQEQMVPGLRACPERQTGEQARTQKASQKGNDPLAPAHASLCRTVGVTVARGFGSSPNAVVAVHRTNTNRATSFWLLPAPGAAAALDRLSADACGALPACTLPPHITLDSHRLDTPAIAIERLRRLAEQRSPVQLSPGRITATSRFTQSLILRFASATETLLQPWVQQLRDSSVEVKGDRLDPHLSLLYSQAPLQRRQAVAAQLQAPAGPLLFDQVCVVSHPLTISTPADIAAFRSLAQLTLY